MSMCYGFFALILLSLPVYSSEHWFTYENGLIIKRALQLEINSFTYADLSNILCVNKKTYDTVSDFFKEECTEKKKRFAALFPLSRTNTRSVLVVTTDNTFTVDTIWNTGSKAYNSSYNDIFKKNPRIKACMVPRSLYFDRFCSCVYGVELSQDDKQKSVVTHVKYPLLPSGSIDYTDRIELHDDNFKRYAASFNADYVNHLVCKTDSEQTTLKLLFLYKGTESKEHNVGVFMLRAFKPVMCRGAFIKGYVDYEYSSQPRGSTSKQDMLHIFERHESPCFYAYNFDTENQSITACEYFFTLDSGADESSCKKHSLAMLTEGLRRHVLTWPTCAKNGDTALYVYDEERSSVPKELIEIYVNDLHDSSNKIYEKMEKNDAVKNARIAQATILLGALNRSESGDFNYETVLNFLKKMTAMSHAEGAALYRDFNGECYYTPKDAKARGDLYAVRNDSVQSLGKDVQNIIDAWPLAIDSSVELKNRFKWLADNTKKAMALQPEAFLQLCKDIALPYAKKSWDNGTIGVSWDVPLCPDRDHSFTLYKFDCVCREIYYALHSVDVDEDDTITNVVYRTDNDVDFYFQKAGKFRSHGQRLVRCDG